MPRKTKKQKLRAHTHTAQLPKKDSIEMRRESAPQLSTAEATATAKREQLPLVPKQQSSPKYSPADPDATTYFKHDIQKTALLTGLIIVIEVVLYQLMQNGTLDRLIPALKL